MLSLILSLQHNLVKTLSTLTTSGFLCEDKPIVERDLSLREDHEMQIRDKMPRDVAKRLIQRKLPRGVVKEIMLERILLVTNFSRNRERCRKLSL